MSVPFPRKIVFVKSRHKLGKSNMPSLKVKLLNYCLSQSSVLLFHLSSSKHLLFFFEYLYQISALHIALLKSYRLLAFLCLLKLPLNRQRNHHWQVHNRENFHLCLSFLEILKRHLNNRHHTSLAIFLKYGLILETRTSPFLYS